MAQSFAFNPFTGNFDLISKVTLAAVGSSPAAEGASISSSQVLTLQPADATHPGVITSGAQSFGGIKTFSAGLDVNSNKITSLAAPTLATDAANKSYVDNLVNGLNWKTVVRSATTTSLPSYIYNNGSSGVGATITGVSVGGLPAQDGVTLIAGDRLLVKNETSTNAPYNGIYTVTAPGSGILVYILTRATDCDASAEFIAATVQVSPEASTLAGYGFRQTADPVTVGSTNITWVNFSIGVAYTFTNGIALSGSTVSLANAADLTLKGNVSGGSAFPIDLTGTQATTILNVFSTSLKGLAPASGGGTTNFLRADGTWAAPAAITQLTGDVTAGPGSGSQAATIAANAVTDAKFRQSSGLSIVGRSANTTGNVADITAASDNQIMRRSGTAIGFGSIDLSQSNAVGATVLGVANGGTGQVTTTAAFQALSVLTTKGDILVYGTNTTRLAVGTDGQTLVADSTAGAGVKWGAAGFPQVVAIKDSQTSSTTGGGFNSGAWRTRTLNTLDNPLSYAWVTLSSNQFTLTAGTYYIRASAPGFTVDRHQIKIRNITDSSDTILGQGAMCAASDASQSSAALSGAFTIAGTKTFELQHQCQTSNATNGFGLAMNFSVNSIFGEVEVIKLA